MPPGSHRRVPQRIGRYDLVGRLAVGGMAEVLLGRTSGPEGFVRAVVIKRILPHLAARADFRAMFLDEARMMAGIHHDNVVQIYELGEDGTDLFMVMEYLEGESAAGLLRRMVHVGRGLPMALAAHVVADACDGLHAAHELRDADGHFVGLVHRDVSPHNLFVTYSGRVKLLDFGIAHAAGRSTETEAGQIKGKFAYMSPEQCRGKRLDRRSDLFTMGTVLYELTTARRLFARATDMQTMRAICNEPLLSPSAVVQEYPAALERIVMRALSRARSERYATAAELAAALRQLSRALRVEDPQKELSALMHEIFADRVAQKGSMLQALRARQEPAAITGGEVDAHVVLPTVHAGAGTRTDTASMSFGAVESPRRGALGIAAALLVVAGGVGAYVTLRPAPAPEAQPEAAPSPSSVAIHLDSEPPGAELLLDGVPIGTTPYLHECASSSVELRISFRRAGFEPHQEILIPDVSQRVRVVLVPRASSSASAAPPTQPPPVPPRPAEKSSPAPAPSATGIYKL